MIKFSLKSDQFFQRYDPNCVKNALSRSVEDSFKKFLDQIETAGTSDFQNTTSSSVSIQIHLGQNSREDPVSILRDVANKQTKTDRQTDTG